jgi:hypothetical protein
MLDIEKRMERARQTYMMLIDPECQLLSHDKIGSELGINAPLDSACRCL